MTELRFVDPSEVCDALLFFARLEHRHLEREVEDGAGHAGDYRTIVLSCQAIYRTLVLFAGIRVLSPTQIEGYGDSATYYPTVESSITESFVPDFGKRLRALREARGFKKPSDLARRVYGDGTDAKTEYERKEFANYLGRVENKNKNCGISHLRMYAKALGFTSLSQFWIAIEHAFETAIQDLHSAAISPDNAASSEPVKAEAHARPVPTAADLDRIILGAAGKIVDAINGLGRSLSKRLAKGFKPGTNPRAHASHRSGNPRKGTG